MAQLTVTQTGAITLNNVSTNISATQIIDVSHITQKEITASTGTARKIIDTSKGDAGFGDIKFAAITNLDSTNFLHITIFIDSTTTDSYIHMKIPAGKTFVLNTKNAYTDLSSPASYGDISDVQLEADTAAIQAKIFWAV
jgi:hypothetical protein